MDDRFSNDKILKTLYIPKESSKFIKCLQSVFNLGFIFAAIGWTILFLTLGFDSTVYFIILITFIILALWFFYIAFIKYYSIKVNKYEIKIKNLKQSISFIFITDLHIGNEFNAMNKERLKKIVNKINKLNPELIVFGGDFVNKKYEMNLLNELKNLKAKYKIGVYGNHDSLYLGERKHEVFPREGVEKLKSLGINILNNEGLTINLNKQNLFFGGIPDLYTLNFNITKAFINSEEDSIKILLSHNPDIVDFVDEEDKINLILSGHTHSGQIMFPVIGPLFKMPVKNQWLTRGLFRLNKLTQLFISQGVSYGATRIRIGTECEICLMELVGE